MNTQSTQTPIDRAQPVGFIYFRQRHLLVVSHRSALNFAITEYIEAKPLVDSESLCWDGTQILLQQKKDYMQQYHIREFMPP